MNQPVDPTQSQQGEKQADPRQPANQCADGKYAKQLAEQLGVDSEEEDKCLSDEILSAQLEITHAIQLDSLSLSNKRFAWCRIRRDYCSGWGYHADLSYGFLLPAT